MDMLAFQVIETKGMIRGEKRKGDPDFLKVKSNLKAFEDYVHSVISDYEKDVVYAQAMSTALISGEDLSFYTKTMVVGENESGEDENELGSQKRRRVNIPSQISTNGIIKDTNIITSASHESIENNCKKMLSTKNPDWNEEDAHLVVTLLCRIRQNQTKYGFYSLNRHEHGKTYYLATTVPHKCLLIETDHKRLRYSKFNDLMNEDKVGLVIFNHKRCGTEFDQHCWTKLRGGNIPFIILNFEKQAYVLDSSAYAVVLTTVDIEQHSLFNTIRHLAYSKFNNHPLHASNPLLSNWRSYLDQRLPTTGISWSTLNTVIFLRRIHKDESKCKLVTSNMYFSRLKRQLAKDQFQYVQNFQKMGSDRFRELVHFGPSKNRQIGLVVCNRGSYKRLEKLSGTNGNSASLGTTSADASRYLSHVDSIPYLCVKHGIPYTVVEYDIHLQHTKHWIYALVFTCVEQNTHFKGICQKASMNCNSNPLRQYSLSGLPLHNESTENSDKERSVLSSNDKISIASLLNN